MIHKQRSTFRHPFKTNPLAALAVLAVASASAAGAGSLTITQLDGQRALSVNKGENALVYVTLPAASADIVGSGSVDSRLSVRTPHAQDVNVSLNHARNEVGTLFVYLNADVYKSGPLHTTLPLILTNSLTGKSVTMNVQVNATAERYR